MKECGMNKITNQASTLVKLTDELRALGVDTSYEDITGAVSFDARDGRHFVVGNGNGIIGADIYASRASFERGDLPQGDWETASEDPASIAKELHALAFPLTKAKFNIRYAEIQHGYNSPQRAEVIKRHTVLQMALGAIELRELGIEPVNASIAKELHARVAPLKKGEEIRIKPEWQDKGDDKLKWFAYDDEANGRVGIYSPMPEMAIQPWQTVDTSMVERAGSSQ